MAVIPSDSRKEKNMSLEELKALLESGAITQGQYEAMCKQFGYEIEKPEPPKDPENPPVDYEKLIQQAVDRATNKLGNDNKKLREELEKLRKEKLTDEELRALEDAEKEKSLAEREAAVKTAENKLYAITAIKKAGLDDGSETALDILALVNANETDTIDANITALKALVDKLVKAEVEKIFKSNGRNPEKGAGGAGGENPYLLGASFNLTKQMELESTNPELARQLKAAAGK